MEYNVIVTFHMLGTFDTCHGTVTRKDGYLSISNFLGVKKIHISYYISINGRYAVYAQNFPNVRHLNIAFKAVVTHS